jgi:WD40 repeat protein
MILLVFIQKLYGTQYVDPEAPFAFACSPTGDYIAIGTVSGNIKILDSMLTEIQILYGHKYQVYQVLFSPDGKYLASCSEDIIIFDIKTGEIVFTLFEHQFDVVSISYRFDGERLVSSSTDGTVKIWDIKDRNAIMTLDMYGSCVSYSPDGTKIIVMAENEVKILDANNGNELSSIYDKNLHINSVAYSNDGEKMVICYVNTKTSITEIRIYDSNNHQLLNFFNPGRGEIKYGVFSPDDKCIVIAFKPFWGGSRVRDPDKLMFIDLIDGNILDGIIYSNGFILSRHQFAISHDNRYIVSSIGKDIIIREIK